MREQSAKPIIVIPAERDVATPSADRPLAALNELGITLIRPMPPRAWDGRTIPLAGFRIS